MDLQSHINQYLPTLKGFEEKKIYGITFNLKDDYGNSRYIVHICVFFIEEE